MKICALVPNDTGRYPERLNSKDPQECVCQLDKPKNERAPQPQGLYPASPDSNGLLTKTGVTCEDCLAIIQHRIDLFNLDTKRKREADNAARAEELEAKKQQLRDQAANPESDLTSEEADERIKGLEDSDRDISEGD